MNADKVRLQRAAIKIGRCLFYRDHKRVMPNENCKDIRLCEREEDVPELYTLSWEMSKVNWRRGFRREGSPRPRPFRRLWRCRHASLTYYGREFLHTPGGKRATCAHPAH